MNELIEILNKHQINGFQYEGGTDKATDHSYDTFYCKEFERFKNTKGTLLEIGSFNGGSGLLWHEYLPFIKIVMTDIQDNIPKNIKDKLNRSEFILMDGYQKESIKALKNKYPEGFDIIIEDGPHNLETQMFALKEYSKLLKKGGVLIIEDIQNESDLNELLTVKLRGKTVEAVDLRHIKNRYDDLMIVVRK
jgi:predicted O-methyltransferase YrrM